MDYIEKMKELVKKGDEFEAVTENLYLNYGAAIDTDEVYRIRKKMANRYQCNLNDVKLIGSSHTGYTYKCGLLQKRENPKDYDFGIIDVNVFIRYYHKIPWDNITGKQEDGLRRNLQDGKIHPLYAGKDILDELESINGKIQEELNVQRHITVCFYLSERDFIKGLVDYNRLLFSSILKEQQAQLEGITEIPITIKEIGKIGGTL